VRSHSVPAPTFQPQGESLGNEWLTHVNLNTGRVGKHRDADLPPDIYVRLLPLLQQGAGPIPGHPGLVAAIHHRKDAVQGALGRPAMPIVEFGLAWGPQGASSVWRPLCVMARPLRRLAKPAAKVPVAFAARRLPWLAVVWFPSITTLSADEVLRLSGFIQFLGLALLRQRLLRN